MKKGLRVVLVVLVAIILMGAVAAGLLYMDARLPFLSKAGWTINEQGQSCYQDYFGANLTGWQVIDGQKYYFDPQNGAMATGWLIQNDKIYLFDENGNLLTDWQEVDGQKYYLNEDGTLATGWQEIGKETYYLGTDGAVRTFWQNIDGSRYYFRSTGKMVTGWLDLDGKRYYLDEEGKMLTGWQTLANHCYYLDADGAMYVGHLELDGNHYYLKVNGVMATGWIELGGKQYYYDETGAMVTGWQEIDGEQIFFDSDGSRTGWQVVDGVYSYIGADGNLAAGEELAAAVEQAFPFEENCTILLGKDNPLPEDWIAYPIEVENGWTVDGRCYNQFVQMLSDCRAAGNETGINSAYRSPEDQQEIWDNRVALYMSEGASEEDAIARVSREVAIPGYSEHQLGFAIDIDGFAAHVWMANNSYKYGFIIRYPEDKQDITGTVYEPWHVRFVGYELAQYLYENNLCLEEYYA